MIKPKNQFLILLFTSMTIAFTGCDSESEDPQPEVVTGAVINAEVGGADQPNQVYIDLSSENQTVVNRGNWDLAFYNGSELQVKLNSSVGMLAQATTANDILEISEEDTAGLRSQLDLDAIFAALMGPPPSWLAETAGWIDALSGNLEETTIAEISSTDDQNLVYILNRGKNPDDSRRGWIKLRIIQNGAGYKLQYAEINASTYEEVEISKDKDHNFTYFSFDDGIVSIEPEKSDWDIAFTTFTNLLPIDASTYIPYFYKDYVIQNINNVETAQVSIEGNITYENFTVADIAGLEFSTELNAIGSSWRTVAQPNSGLETDVNRDRFYIISDADENYYKLRFTRLVDVETGERGYPQIEYELLTNE